MEQTYINNALSRSRMTPQVKVFSFHVLQPSLVEDHAYYAL